MTALRPSNLRALRLDWVGSTSPAVVDAAVQPRWSLSSIECRRELPLSLDSVLLDDGGERQVPK